MNMTVFWVNWRGRTLPLRKVGQSELEGGHECLPRRDEEGHEKIEDLMTAVLQRLHDARIPWCQPCTRRRPIVLGGLMYSATNPPPIMEWSGALLESLGFEIVKEEEV